MKKLILIRAGNTIWQQGQPTDDDSRIQGTVSLPLTDQGKQDLQKTADVLKTQNPDFIYSSGNESSGRTAVFLADLCLLKNKKLPDLRELNCGLWQGLRIAEIKKRYGRAYRQWRIDPTSVRPPQGESIPEACQRVNQILCGLYKKNRDKTIVVVASYFVAAIIECLVTGKNLDQLWRNAEQGNGLQIFDLSTTDNLFNSKSQKKIPANA
ncbi:MAG: histidine phosphatase family protein [Planctomycetes bacterium]|nr:histidine phosphatase family protein [Planctomycetota bacterium]